MESKQFNELNDILNLVENVAKKIVEDLKDDGKVSIGEWVQLAFSEAQEVIHVALNAGDVVADKMSTEEMVQLLNKLVEVGKELADIFIKK
jgi:RNA processing factor Prp31